MMYGRKNYPPATFSGTNISLSLFSSHVENRVEYVRITAPETILNHPYTRNNTTRTVTKVAL